MSSQCPTCGQIVGFGGGNVSPHDVHKNTGTFKPSVESEMIRLHDAAQRAISPEQHKEAVREVLDRAIQYASDFSFQEHQSWYILSKSMMKALSEIRKEYE